ncbi:hypothetical protein CXF71_00180 [Colwellia sp. 12G3]|nr:hypothetical protein CXF71_00180 [Colwellia sp. 12G3]
MGPLAYVNGLIIYSAKNYKQQGCKCVLYIGKILIINFRYILILQKTVKITDNINGLFRFAQTHSKIKYCKHSFL